MVENVEENIQEEVTPDNMNEVESPEIEIEPSRTSNDR